MTGNANKLKEVRAILSEGSGDFKPILIESKDLDSTFSLFSEECLSNISYGFLLVFFAVWELQGTTQEVAREKCRRAAELVGYARL